MPAVINQDIGHYNYYPYANQFMAQKEQVKVGADQSFVPEGAISAPFASAVINQDIGHYDYYPYANQFMAQREQEKVGGERSIPEGVIS
jgi:hypothetical protein